jgi:glycosyltransferase involved in cell wall biosynthesis
MSCKITIIMTVLNGEKYIEKSLDSLINQSYREWELLIIENASKDNTKQILYNYQDERIKIKYLDKTISRTAALNLAIENSNTEYIAIFDADDIAMDNWIEEAISFLDGKSEIAVVGGWAYLIDEEGKNYGTLQAPNYPIIVNEFLSFTFPLVHSSLVFRASTLSKYKGPYSEDIDLGHDWHLLINISKSNQIAVMGSFWVKWRRYNESLTALEENTLKARFDKLHNYQMSIKCTKNIYYQFKNINRQAVELLAISYFFLKQKRLFLFLKYFILSFIRSPLAIILNNKILKYFSKSPDFQKKVN